MKILLTGGAGYIGSHTAVELIGLGHEVIIADNLSNSKSEVISRIGKITGKTPAFYPIDVCDKKDLTSLFDENGIDAVIHFAGFKAVGESVKYPEKYFRNNLDSTMTLLEVMEQSGTKKLIFSSSATVYGESQNVPYTEESPTGGCTNPYGWTKYMIEQILKAAVSAHPDLGIASLRYFNPAGAHPSGLIGEDPHDIPNNLFPYIAKVACGKLDHLHVFGNDYPTPDGTGVRDYIHVVDLAKGHAAALTYLADHDGFEVFNLGSGKGSSVLEIVEAYRKASGQPIPYSIDPRRPGDIAQSFADPEKAKKLLHWQTEKTLFDMCADSWNWQKNNPDGYR